MGCEATIIRRSADSGGPPTGKDPDVPAHRLHPGELLLTHAIGDGTQGGFRPPALPNRPTSRNPHVDNEAGIR